jgi:hypothetical protein
MLAHAARWALISVAGACVAIAALVACILVSVMVSPIAACPAAGLANLYRASFAVSDVDR